MKKTPIIFTFLTLVLLVTFSTPFVASAQTVGYQPRTQSELVAYLQGRIAQLLEVKALLERQKGVSTPSYNTTIDTHAALEVTDTTAVLRGEVVLQNGTPVKAWFEYGQDQDFLDQKTRMVAVKSLYDRAIRQSVKALEADERYYFRIAMITKEGVVHYGPVLGFRTDESYE